MKKLHQSTILLLLGALGCGGAAAYLTDGYIDDKIAKHRKALDEEYKPVKVVVPKQNLAPGDVLTYDNLVLRDVPSGFLHEDTVYPETMEEVAGHRLKHSVKRGASVLKSHLSEQRGAGFSTMVAEGKRALTFPVDSVSSMSGMLRPGDKIDLLITLQDGKQSITFPLLRDVKILAAGTAIDEFTKTGPGRGYRTITLAVSPMDAARITHARQVGTTTVVLSSDGKDKGPGYDQPITLNSLLGRPEPAPPKTRSSGRRPAEIILGGIN